MKNYLFEIVSGDYEGEEFFVQAENKEDARAVAQQVAADGGKVRLIGIYSDEDADILGYDTY